MTVARSLDEVEALYERWGEQRYDEDLSQLAHALQTAALADAAGASAPLVAAALLHDVGHLLELAGSAGRERTGDLHHETRGARYLSGLFPATVTTPIALHVRAKRYRVAVDPGYAATLSAGSVASLARQGGPLRPDEVAVFEANPGAPDAIALRAWDDGGKVEGLEVPDLASYRPRLEALVR